jgi:outer membrane protein
MNRRFVSIIWIAAVLSMGSPLWAQAGKIGFVNSEQVLFGTTEGKQGMETLNEFLSEKQQEFDARTQELSSLQSDFATRERTLNAQARAELQSRLEQKQLELRRFQEDAMAAYNQRQEDLLQRMSEKVQRILDDYARENNYLAIFMDEQMGMAYVSPELNITEEIIRLYNETYSPQAAAPADPGAQQ